MILKYFKIGLILLDPVDGYDPFGLIKVFFYFHFLNFILID